MRNFTRRARREVVVCLLSGFLMASSGYAVAQELEEIIVTASKRGEIGIQDLAFSIQALSGNALQEAGSTDMADYFRQIPGLTINNQGPGDKNYIIRGINSTGAGTVGLYLDEVIITGESIDIRGKQPDPKLFDIDRVEVLKGPQGTTFGSSSLSGTIRWIPNKPNYDAFELNIGAGLSTLKESSDIGWQTDAAINVPIVEDVLAIRLSGILLDKAGYLDSRFGDDQNSEETQAGRAMISWRATTDLELSAFAMRQEMKVGARAFYNDTWPNLNLSDTLNGQPLPGQFYQAVLARAGHDEDIDIYNVKFDFTKGWGVITGTHSVFDRYTDTKRETSVASEILFGLPADQNPAFLRNEKERRLETSEIRFASSWQGPVQVLTGVFFQREKRFEVGSYRFTELDTGRPADATEASRRETTRVIDELAIFGEISWDITDRLILNLGGRWFEQDIDEQVNVVTAFIFNPGQGFLDPLHFSFNDTIYRGTLSYRFNDSILTYAQVAEGYRAGGANDRSPMAFTDVFIPPGFNSDSLVNYEFGFKGTFLNGSLLLNTAAYFLDWTDIQLALQAQNQQGLSFTYRGNGGAAEVKGVEMDLAYLPMERLRLGGSINYMTAKLTEDLPRPQVAVKGDTIPYSPKWSGNINFRYESPIVTRAELTAFLGGEWSYLSSSATELSLNTGTYRPLESYDVLNLRAGIEGDDWSLVFAMTNVLDNDEVISYAPDFGTGANLGDQFFPDSKVRLWPRGYSVTFRKQWF